MGYKNKVCNINLQIEINEFPVAQSESTEK